MSAEVDMDRRGSSKRERAVRPFSAAVCKLRSSGVRASSQRVVIGGGVAQEAHERLVVDGSRPSTWPLENGVQDGRVRLDAGGGSCSMSATCASTPAYHNEWTSVINLWLPLHPPMPLMLLGLLPPCRGCIWQPQLLLDVVCIWQPQLLFDAGPCSSTMRVAVGVVFQ